MRYERDRPGELLHLDTKKLGRFSRPGKRVRSTREDRNRGAGWEYVHVCVDDHSRVAYVEVLEEQGKAACAGFLERAAAWYASRGVQVERVMTDNGGCYRSHRFRRAVVAHGARQIFTQPYRPQTNGKAERFIQTAIRGWAYKRAYRSSAARTQMLPGFLNRYNRRRPHRALGNTTPLSRLEALV